MRKKSDQGIYENSNSKIIAVKEGNGTREVKIVPSLNFEKSNSDFLPSNVDKQELKFNASNVKNDEKSQIGEIINKIILKGDNPQNKENLDRLDLSNLNSEWKKFDNANANNMTTTSYIPKKIIKKDPQKINDAFKTRPENVKMIQEIKIIGNDSKTNTNFSSYTQLRMFHNENLKRNQVYYYNFSNENTETPSLRLNDNIVFKTRNLENN